jgi:MFS family permease
VYSTLYLQFLGFSPFEAGLIQIPTSVVMILLAARFGAIADRTGPRFLLTAAPILLAGGTLLMLPISEQSDFWTFGVASFLVFSLGLAMLVAPITSTALKSAPAQYAGIASGVNSTVSRVGSLTAVAVIGLVVTLVFTGQVTDPDAVPIAQGQTDPALRESSVDAFRAGMLVAAGLALAGAVVAALGISDSEARGEGRAVSEPAAAPAES